MLALPISFKPEHYETFRDAKRIGITDVFQAKLGWLVGQMYSRVGTPDFDNETLADKVSTYMDGAAIWLSEDESKTLRTMVDEYKSNSNDTIVDLKKLRALISKIPKRRNSVIDAVLDVATELGIIGNPSTERRDLRLALEKNETLIKLLP